jgi:predicted TIM-barrel fold metal-dependent hydrolase
MEEAMPDDNTPSSVVKADAEDARRYWLKEGWSPGGFVREVDYAANSKGVHPLFKGIKIVDCDTHFTEPADLFETNAPARLKGKLPRVERIDDIDYWMVGDRNFGSLGGNVIGKDNNKLLGRLAYQNYDQIDPGSFSVKPRLKAMDDMGVWAQICFQNGGVTQAGSLVSLGDPDLAYEILRIYNDACAERMKESGERIFCMASLPYWDQGLLEKETRRVIDMGVRGVVMPDRPERIGVSGFIGPDGKCSPFWEGFFEMCSATGTPLNFHLNSALDAESATWDNLGFDQRLPLSAMLHHIGACATMANFMVSGLLDKFPDLKIGLIESGAGWVPFALEAMEHQIDEFRTRENRGLQRRPREYFRQFWVSYWFETFAPKHMLGEIGVDRIMFETDYPHPTSLYPGVQDKLVETLGGYDYETRRRVLERNAVELYNLPF